MNPCCRSMSGSVRRSVRSGLCPPPRCLEPGSGRAVRSVRSLLERPVGREIAGFRGASSAALLSHTLRVFCRIVLPPDQKKQSNVIYIYLIYIYIYLYIIYIYIYIKVSVQKKP